MLNTSVAFDVRFLSCLPLGQIAGSLKTWLRLNEHLDLWMSNNGAEPVVPGGRFVFWAGCLFFLCEVGNELKQFSGLIFVLF